MIMGECRCTALEWSMMQDQKSLMLRWRLFSRGGSNILTIIFASKGGQYYNSGCMLSHGPQIIHDARPKIVDAQI